MITKCRYRQEKNPITDNEKTQKINKQTNKHLALPHDIILNKQTVSSYYQSAEPATSTKPNQAARMPRDTPRPTQETRRRVSGQAQPRSSPRKSVLLDDVLEQDLELYPEPQQQEQLQEQQQQQQGPAQGPAAEDEVQIVDPNEDHEVRNWK